MPVLRLALAGTMQGPPVFDMMSLLGKEKSASRLKNLSTILILCRIDSKFETRKYFSKRKFLTTFVTIKFTIQKHNP